MIGHEGNAPVTVFARIGVPSSRVPRCTLAKVPSMKRSSRFNADLQQWKQINQSKRMCLLVTSTSYIILPLGKYHLVAALLSSIWSYYEHTWAMTYVGQECGIILFFSYVRHSYHRERLTKLSHTEKKVKSLQRIRNTSKLEDNALGSAQSIELSVVHQVWEKSNGSVRFHNSVPRKLSFFRCPVKEMWPLKWEQNRRQAKYLHTTAINT